MFGVGFLEHSLLSMDTPFVDLAKSAEVGAFGCFSIMATSHLVMDFKRSQS